MKNFLFLLIILVSCAPQNNRTLRGDLTAEELERMNYLIQEIQFGGVELSEEQLKSLSEIHIARWQEMDGILAPMLPGVPIHKLEDKFKNKLSAVLTDEQVAKMETYNLALDVAIEAQEDFKANNLASIKTYGDFLGEIVKEEGAVIRMQRVKLEKLMSEADKTERRNLIIAKKENRANLDSAKHAATSIIDLREIQKTKGYKALLAEKYAIKTRMEQFAKKYTTEINSLMDEIKPQREEWFKRKNEKYNMVYADAPLKKINEVYFRSHWERCAPKDDYSESNHRFFIMRDTTGRYLGLDQIAELTSETHIDSLIHIEAPVVVPVVAPIVPPKD